MTDSFLITGLFRSGTTFLARALNAHKDLTVASDPYFEYYKFLRNKYFATKPGFDPSSPLSDYFLADHSEVKSFHESVFDQQINQADLERLKLKIAGYCEPYSPKIIPGLQNLKTGNAIDFLDQAIRLAGNTYSTGSEKLIGTKEVWTDEFISPCLNLGQKVIHIIRDPRAIIASNRKSKTGAYPVLFLVRQWRKSVSEYIRNKDKEGYLMLRYEDIILNPEIAFHRICSHLEVEFDPDILDGSKFKDGAGEPWEQNSSHGSSTKINASFMDKWKSVLPQKEIDIIEWLCSPEMEVMNYEHNQKDFPELQLLQFSDEYPNIADWIKKFDFNLNEAEIIAEKKRANYLTGKESITQDLITKYFLNKETFNKLKVVN